MVDSYCEILWTDSSGSGLGRYPTANYGLRLDDLAKQAVIALQRLRSKILDLCIKNSLTTNVNRKLMYFRSEYTFNTQDYKYTMFFAIVKMVRPETCAGYSYIKSKLENIKMSHFKHDILKSNLHISERTNEISISGETYSGILSRQFKLYSTSSCPLFKD